MGILTFVGVWHRREINTVVPNNSISGIDLIGARKRGKKMQSLSTFLLRCRTGVIIASVLIATAGIQPALAQEAEEPKATEEVDIAKEGAAYDGAPEEVAEGSQDPIVFENEIVVTGFRQSLAASVDLKRDAVNARDSIVVEDIGKMPDLNLAEAIQRVPGVAIVREGGEGRQMSLRGLGAAFTRVTLNGMEVPASNGGLDSSGGVNRGRVIRLQRLFRRALQSHRHQQVVHRLD